MHEKGKKRAKWIFNILNPKIHLCKQLILKGEFGRGEWIRTTDLLVPNQAL